jgi:hypothetical protein
MCKSINDIWRTKPANKLQRKLSDLLHEHLANQLIESLTNKQDIKQFSTKSDRHLVFGTCPDASGKILADDVFISNIRFYLGLPQLLKVKDKPIMVGDGTEMAYEANRCRYHHDEVCDRHIAHAHSCKPTSSSKKIDRHEHVKHVRADLITEVGYTDKNVEPRRNEKSNQKRADIFFTDKTLLGRHPLLHRRHHWSSIV